MPRPRRTTRHRPRHAARRRLGLASLTVAVACVLLAASAVIAWRAGAFDELFRSKGHHAYRGPDTIQTPPERGTAGITPTPPAEGPQRSRSPRPPPRPQPINR